MIIFFSSFKWERVKYLIQVEIVLGGGESVALLVFGSQSLQDLVEDVIVALLGRVGDDTRLFEQVLGDFGAGDHSATNN